jgi:NAD(P)-dependent dehydrogenase (short-subunit alcohol dehydrogenase family)
MPDFDGKVSLVTGGGSGIGRSVARLYAQGGAKVIVVDINDVGGVETVEGIRAEGGEAHFYHTDVSQIGGCEKMVDFAMEKYGRLDVACNNAGISGESNPTGDYSPESWERVIRTNLSGVFYCMRYEIPAMLKNKYGVIINMASVLGQVAFATSPAYVAAKHGVVGLTRTAAVEYAQQGIRVNAVGPSFIKTPMIFGSEEDGIPYIHKMLANLHPMGRLGESAEVAELVAWLSSDKASFVTGSFYAVDGGYLAR